MAIRNFLDRTPRPTNPNRPVPAGAEWRCLECAKLLGVRRGARLHIRLHGHDYDVSLPAEAICRGCGAHNQT